MTEEKSGSGVDRDWSTARTETPPSDFRPAEVFHPMEYLHEELEARGWTLDSLAIRIVREKLVDEWLREKAAWEFYDLRDPDLLMGKESAEALERVLGISAEFWLNCENAWRERQKENAQ